MTNKNRAGTILSSFAYTYRADGNILTEVDHTGATTTYGYDMLGRLVSEVGNSGSRFYTYDTAGNRTQVIIDTATTISYNYNSDGSLASETSSNGSVSETTAYAYDLNGNLTAKTKGVSVTNYAYDVWGNMTSGAGATYAYNAQGLRVAKTVNGETDNFTLVGGNVWADGTTNYLRGIELISNGTQLYLYNVRGDVIQLADLSGNVTKTYDYDAYGNEYARDLGDENPFRYCGEYYDTETGFIYLRARYYDPMVGRFVAMDTHWNPSNAIYGDNPVKTSSAEDCKSLYPNINAIKQSTNQYSYCANNPVLYADANGEFFFLAAGAALAALGALAGAVISYVVNGEVDWKDVAIGALVGGAIGLGGGALIALHTTGTALATTTQVLLAGAKWASALAASGATSSYALGNTFEKWFYKAHDIAKTAQQVVVNGIGRIDAFLNGRIYELKNYSWDKYSPGQINSIINKFVDQASRYLQISSINDESVKGVTYYFSSRPPQEIIDALRKIGVAVEWVSTIR